MSKKYWHTESFSFGNYKLTQSKELPDDITSLISFVNNEDRAMALFRKDIEDLKNITNVHLMILNRDLEKFDNQELDELISKVKGHLEDKPIKLYTHFLNFYDEEFASQVYSTFKSNNLFDTPVLLDFTSCPYPVIIPFSEVLIGHSNRKVTVCYTIPEQYDLDLIKTIEEEEVNGEIRTYGSMSKEETILAIIAGLENQKPKRIVDHLQPTFGYLLNDIFTVEIEELNLSKQTMQLHSDLINKDHFKQLNLPRYDINRILNGFQLLHSLHENKNLVIAPFGTKIQRIMALLFVESKPNLAIIDIIPKELSFKKITTGIRDQVYYRISRDN